MVRSGRLPADKDTRTVKFMYRVHASRVVQSQHLGKPLSGALLTDRPESSTFVPDICWESICKTQRLQTAQLPCATRRCRWTRTIRLQANRAAEAFGSPRKIPNLSRAPDSAHRATQVVSHNTGSNPITIFKRQALPPTQTRTLLLATSATPSPPRISPTQCPPPITSPPPPPRPRAQPQQRSPCPPRSSARAVRSRLVAAAPGARPAANTRSAPRAQP